jgi:uncharacterized membrane-anchored protein YhcB (DUF1043 family)
MGFPEVMGLLGIGVTIGGIIGKVSSAVTGKQATLEQRVVSLERSFETFQTGIHKHMDRQDEKLDRILENWYQVQSVIHADKGEK